MLYPKFQDSVAWQANLSLIWSQTSEDRFSHSQEWWWGVGVRIPTVSLSISVNDAFPHATFYKFVCLYGVNGENM